MRKVGVEIFGNPASAIRAFRASGAAATSFGAELTKVGVSAEKSAQASVNAAVRTETRLRSEMIAYRQLAEAAAVGSREQIAAANLAAKAQGRLAGATAVSARESQALMARAGRGVRGHAREHEVAHQKIMGGFRERTRIGPRIANVTGFGPGFLATGTLGYALDKSVRAAITFHEQMELISTQAGASQREVTKMSAAVLKLSPHVAQTPEELAKGLFHIESYGIKGAKALNLLRIAAEGAAVGKAPIESVANALLAISGSHIRGIKGPGQAMGVMNAIIGAGNMRMDDLAGAISTGVLQKAKNFGISIQEVGAALGVMTHAGVPAQQAATRLGMTFAKLAAGAPVAQKELKKIGLTTDELGGTIRSKGLLPALELLKAHLDASGLSATQQAALLTRAFGGGRSSGSLMALVQNLDDFQKTQDRIARNSGQFGKAWEHTQKTAAFATHNFKAALSVLGITLGSAVLPGLTKVLVGFTTWIAKMTQSGKLQRDIKTITHQVGEVMKVAGHWIGVAARAAQGLAHAMGGWKNLIIGLLALKFGSKLLGWAGALNGLIGRLGAGGLLGAEGAAAGLRLKLLGLMRLGAIVIPIELLIHAKGVTNWMKDNIPGFKGMGDWVDSKVPFLRHLDEKHGLLAPGEGGRPLGANPYKPGSDLYKAWARGAEGRKLDPKHLSVAAAKAWEQGHEWMVSITPARPASAASGHGGGGRGETAAQKQARLAHEAALRQARNTRAAARQHAAQLRLLGLGPTSDALVPTRAALKRELGNVQSVIKGTFLDTAEHRSLLSKIRRLLSGQLGALSADVRAKVKEMLDGLKGQMNEFDGFNLTAAEKRRRWLDRRLADRYRQGHAGVTGTGPGGSGKHTHHHTHHHTYKIDGSPGETDERMIGRAHWRLRNRLA